MMKPNISAQVFLFDEGDSAIYESSAGTLHDVVILRRLYDGNIPAIKSEVPVKQTVKALLANRTGSSHTLQTRSAFASS